MKKLVKQIVLTRLGRPPKRGEVYVWPDSDGMIGGIASHDHVRLDTEAVTREEREAEIDVPEPVPAWIKNVVGDVRWHEAEARHATAVVPEDCPLCMERRGILAAAHRAEVERAAKEAAKAITLPGSIRAAEAERLILDAFLGAES